MEPSVQFVDDIDRLVWNENPTANEGLPPWDDEELVVNPKSVSFEATSSDRTFTVYLGSFVTSIDLVLCLSELYRLNAVRSSIRIGLADSQGEPLSAPMGAWWEVRFQGNNPGALFLSHDTSTPTEVLKGWKRGRMIRLTYNTTTRTITFYFDQNKGVVQHTFTGATHKPLIPYVSVNPHGLTGKLELVRISTNLST